MLSLTACSFAPSFASDGSIFLIWLYCCSLGMIVTCDTFDTSFAVSDLAFSSSSALRIFVSFKTCSAISSNEALLLLNFDSVL